MEPPVEVAGPETEPHSVPTAGGMSPHAAGEVIVLPYNDEDSVGRLVTRHRDELACVIFDPKAGILPPQEMFVRAVREMTRRNDVLLIFDEIVGFRVGMGGLQEYYGIVARSDDVRHGDRRGVPGGGVRGTGGYYGFAGHVAGKHRVSSRAARSAGIPLRWPRGLRR